MAVGAASFAGNLAILTALAVFGNAVGLTGIVGGAILLGFSLGCVLGTRTAGSLLAIGLGAFAAALTAWLPVIFVTYGFGLLALPLLGMYGCTGALGAHMGRRHAITRQAPN
jgi:hypothetical protein